MKYNIIISLKLVIWGSKLAMNVTYWDMQNHFLTTFVKRHNVIFPYKYDMTS
jgi:hypothetical protein